MAQNPSARTEIPCTGSIAIDGTNTARTLPILLPFAISEVRVVMHTAYTGATASVITVNREIKVGTSTNQIAIATFTIPITAALGQVFLVKVADFGDTTTAPGETISFVSDGGADATTTASFAAVGYRFDEGLSAGSATVTSMDKPRSGVGGIKVLTGTEA
jgi:hypothetical protein